ncbi:MAG: acetolactate synthase small subunit [Spirochaetes bacterium]|uniref:Acetolactate synthase small subunit n=1 Tax=Candidatus Aphodenecus pullistercoris TaxID=2840669 RepID=A0A9D9E776_9SPIR|nr:acetolactate synthase small subunit [Candidatus Aphodenecus pullistercoris]
MRVVGLFSRRGYNIHSLSVGETERPEVSRITIVVSVDDERVISQIRRQVEKLVDVRRVYSLTSADSLQKELVLVKIRADEESRTHLVELAEIFKAKIIDVTKTTMTLQLTGDFDKLEAFMSLVEDYGIVELARTGITALERGSRALSEIDYEN